MVAAADADCAGGGDLSARSTMGSGGCNRGGGEAVLHNGVSDRATAVHRSLDERQGGRGVFNDVLALLVSVIEGERMLGIFCVKCIKH